MDTVWCARSVLMLFVICTSKRGGELLTLNPKETAAHGSKIDSCHTWLHAFSRKHTYTYFHFSHSTRFYHLPTNLALCNTPPKHLDTSPGTSFLGHTF